MPGRPTPAPATLALATLALTTLASASPASARGEALAGAPSLGLPLACVPGADCWPVRLLDLDAGPGVADPFCGPLSDDDHGGTDFAVPDLAALERGVPVLAAAPGAVVGTRDGEPDVNVEEIGGRAAVAGVECGNGVRLDHGDGWTTQYCHLKRGSVAVAPGDEVAAGDALGEVGLSGWTSFPHVHLSVEKDGVDVDPYTGRAAEAVAGLAAGCAAEGPNSAGDGLWAPEVAAALGYKPAVLTKAGLAGAPVDWEDVREGRDPPPLEAGDGAAVLWFEGYGLKAGDRVEVTIEAPDGSAFETSVDAEKAQARFFRFAGTRLQGGAAPGAYRGEAVLVRGGEEVDRAEVAVEAGG